MTSPELPQQPAALTVDQAIQKAITHHRQGQLQDAERLYRAILKAQPSHPDANHNLGVLAVQVKHPAAALPLFKAALLANPDQGQYVLSYTEALLATGQAQEALDTIRNAIQRGFNPPAAHALLQKAGASIAAGHPEKINPAHTKITPASLTESLKSKKPIVKKGNLSKKRKPAQASPITLKSLSQAEIDRLGELFNAGRYIELESRARILVEQHPESGIAWMMLGISLRVQGRDALPALRRATELLPDNANTHYNLGNALKSLGQLDNAIASYRRALEIEPNHAGAHNNLGNALQNLGQPDAAVASYRRVLETRPDHAEAHNNLGNALQDLGQMEDAIRSYRRALEIKPDYAEAHNNLGNALKDLGQIADALSSYRQALAIKPAFVEAHNNLGNALKDLGHLDDAVTSYRRSLEINPDYAEAHSNLGNTLKSMGQLEEAVASYRRALEINPTFVEALCNLGVALQDLGQLEDSTAIYHQVLAINPGYVEAHSNLLFIRNYQSEQPAGKLLAEARRFGDLIAGKAHPYSGWSNPRNPGKCLRVGLVSGDLRNHPVSYFIESVLAALASQAAGRLELVAYYNHFHSDALTERIKTHCHGWRSAVGLSDEILARRIRDDGIDILIDLSGHTAHNRLPLFAWKPAPVQASWLGYFATTGAAAIDYLIADQWTLPQSDEAHFTERIWRLPETRLCFSPPGLDIEVAPLPALGNGFVTFGCFNNLTKLNDKVVALWSRVLTAVPGSRLFLKAKQLKEASVLESIVNRFAAQGINAERLILEGPGTRVKYLAAYHRVDITLDPFPFPGGTTSAESLWMGAPVLTLTGDRFISRQGVGLLMNARLPEWVAADADDYVAKASQHATDLQRLASLRAGLRQQVLASPLFDAPRFAIHFEAALRGMWSGWCKRLP